MLSLRHVRAFASARHARATSTTTVAATVAATAANYYWYCYRYILSYRCRYCHCYGYRCDDRCLVMWHHRGYFEGLNLVLQFWLVTVRSLPIN